MGPGAWTRCDMQRREPRRQKAINTCRYLVLEGLVNIGARKQDSDLDVETRLKWVVIGVWRIYDWLTAELSGSREIDRHIEIVFPIEQFRACRLSTGGSITWAIP